MNDEQFNLISEMGVYDGKRRYNITEINTLENILFDITGERYRVRGCSACLSTLKNKLYSFYLIKKESIQNAQSEPKKTTKKRRTTKRDSEQNDDSNS